MCYPRGVVSRRVYEIVVNASQHAEVSLRCVGVPVRPVSLVESDGEFLMSKSVITDLQRSSCCASTARRRPSKLDACRDASGHAAGWQTRLYPNMAKAVDPFDEE